MLAEVTVMSLEQFITTVGSIITAVSGWVVDMLGIITGNPILLFSCGVSMAFTIVGLLKRIFNF